MASYRGQLTENGLVQAIREIYNFFWRKTKEKYTKTQLSDAYKVFVTEEQLIVAEKQLIVPSLEHPSCGG